MATPQEILDSSYRRAATDLARPIVTDDEIASRIDYVCRNLQNRAGVRVLLACALAKAHHPDVDIRKPYTQIGDADAYSGRGYDEVYVTAFINQHQLPCNPTTAFLTPALRNRNIVLTPDVNLVGKPPRLYQTILGWLTDVYDGRISAADLLAETIRRLLVVKEERRRRMETLLADLKTSEGAIPLSAEAIIRLIEQHLQSPKSSRLPVLIIAAAYQASSVQLGERVLPLESHNAADEQTGAPGDLQITLVDDDRVVTSYEMKTRKVTKEDVERALQKIGGFSNGIDNYIFITTDTISQEVSEYVAGMYERTGGIEFVVLDCVAFLRHFLHLFHRLRMRFLESYQSLVLLEPESAVSQPLKEAFLALRQAAESGADEGTPPEITGEQ